MHLNRWNYMENCHTQWCARYSIVSLSLDLYSIIMYTQDRSNQPNLYPIPVTITILDSHVTIFPFKSIQFSNNGMSISMNLSLY